MLQRQTIQGTLVLEAVRALRCHATADEIYTEVAKTHPNISRATVYRNLNHLAELGEIRKIETPAGPDRFDHLTDRHYHVQCTVCGRVFDIDMDYMEELERKIRDRHGFQITGHRIMFQGVCPQCGASKG